MVDEHTKFSFIYPLEDGKLESAVDYLFTISSIFGFPTFVVVDDVEEDFITFKERFQERLEEFSKLENVVWNRSFVTLDKAKEMDSVVEAEALDFVNKNPTTWDQELDVLLLKVRINRRNDINASPYYLMFRKEFPNSDQTRRFRKEKKVPAPEEIFSDLSASESEGDPDFLPEKRPGHSAKKIAKTLPGKQLLTIDKNISIRPSKYLKLSLEMRDEISKFAIANSASEASRVYSEKLKCPLSENSVRNFVAAFRKLTPTLRQDIGKSMVENGYLHTCEIFSDILGFKLSKQLAGCLKKHYLKNSKLEKVEKRKMKFCETSRKLIGKYAVEHGTAAAVKEFSERFQTKILPGTVRKFKWAYLKTDTKDKDPDQPLRDPPSYPELPAYPGYSQVQAQRSTPDMVVDLRRPERHEIPSGDNYYLALQPTEVTVGSSFETRSKGLGRFEKAREEHEDSSVSKEPVIEMFRNEAFAVDGNQACTTSFKNHSSSISENKTQLLDFIGNFHSEISSATPNMPRLRVEHVACNVVTTDIVPVDLSVDVLNPHESCAPSIIKNPVVPQGASDEPEITGSVESRDLSVISVAVDKGRKSGPGRRPLFAPYESGITEKLLQIAADGGRVSERVVFQVAKKLISKSDPNLVNKLSMSWVKSFLRRMKKPV